MTPKTKTKKPRNPKHRRYGFKKAQRLRNEAVAKAIADMNRPRLDCGCIDHNDDAFVGCESCGYKSCLDCHHIDSTPANVDDWMCKKGHGCNAPLTRAMKVRGEEE